MNDATSHNHPLANNQQVNHGPMGVVNPTVDYLDVNELTTKKRKNKEGISKYHSRVPILNQTEYFLHR